jgi:hypothetical protein
LLPIFTLLIAVAAGVWLYSSYTDLDFFTIRNHQTLAGPCSEMDSLPTTQFHSTLLVYLAKDGDSSLVSAFDAGKKLSQAIHDSSTCIHALSMKQAADEAVTSMRLLLLFKYFSKNYNHALVSRAPAEADSLSSGFIAEALKKDSAQFLVKNHETNPYESFAVMYLSNSFPLGYKDSLENTLIQSEILLSEAVARWNLEREREFSILAEARITHGLKMEEARTKIFMLSLLAWMVSISVISLLYLKSVFRRSSAWAGPSVEADKFDDEQPQDQNQELVVHEKYESQTDNIESPLILMDLDLSKVFFDCGGDIQLMKKAVNRHMTTTFAAIGNLKTYRRNNNLDGATRVLKVLSESNAQMGFASMQSRIDSLMDQLINSKSNLWSGLDDLLMEMAAQIETLRDRLGSHPAFKN